MTECIKNDTKDCVKQEYNDEKKEWHFKSCSPTSRFLVHIWFQNIAYSASSSDSMRENSDEALWQGRAMEAFGNIKFFPEEDIGDDAVDVYNDDTKQGLSHID